MVRSGVVAVAALMVVGLSGCGSSGGPSAADKAAAARASHAAAVKAHRSAVYRECKGLMASLDTKLSNLDALLQAGVQFDEYSSRLGQVSIAYSDLIKALKTNGGADAGCINQVGTPLRAAYSDYIQAGRAWDSCVQSYNCSFDKGSPTLTTVQGQWARARSSITKAEAALTKLAPQ